MAARNFLARAAVLVLAVFALLSNLHFFRKAAGSDFARKDAISLYERRFEGLKGVLPPRGVVGYVSDHQARDIRFDAGSGDFYLTQYALAPLIVVYSLEPTFIVGNFRRSTPTADFLRSRNLILLKDFGNGVMLFRNESR